MYLIAIFLPPFAVLFCGKPFQALINIFLTLCFWLPGMIHAIMVVSEHKNNERNEKMIKAMGRNSESLQGTIEHNQYNEYSNNSFIG